MGRFVIGRVLAAFPTLILISLAAFFLNTAARGDPAELALRQAGIEPTPEMIAQYRSRMGLDDTLPQRYLTWVWNMLHGDFGRSFLDQRLVSEKIGERIEPTLRLGLSAFAVTAIVGVTLGVIFGLMQNTPVDYAGRFVTQLFAAVPSFWLGLILISVVAERSSWLPVGGYGGPRYLVLPVIALAAGASSQIIRYTRNAVIEIWRMDYVRTARAKGLRQSTVAVRHALPNALLPVITCSDCGSVRFWLVRS